MRETLKRLAKLTAGYSLVTLIGPLFTILLTPLYTRVLTPADYGVVDVATAVFSILSAVALFGIDTALGVHFFDEGKTHQAELVTSAFTLVAGLGAVVALLIATFSAPLAGLLYQDQTRQPILLLVALNIFTAPFYFVSIASMRLKMDIRRVNAIGLTYLLTAVASNIILILVLNLHATGVVAASALAYGVAAVVGTIISRHVYKSSPDPALMKTLLNVGGSILPGTLSYLILAGSDRILLTQYVNQTEIGLYAIANKLGSMAIIVISTVWSAWWPLALEMAGKPDATRQYARVFEYFLMGSALVSLSIGLFAPEILSLFTRQEYLAAAPYTLALMPYFGPIQTAATCFSIGLYVSKRTHYISIALGIAAAINILLNVILNPMLGVWGAIVATLAGSSLYAIIIYRFSQRQLQVTYRWLRAISFLGVYTLIIVVFLAVPVLNQTLTKLAAIGIITVAAFLTGLITLTQVKYGAVLAGQQIRRTWQSSTSV